MTVNEQIKELINRKKELILKREFKNSEKEQLIVYDGIVNEEEFNGVLFLLKEAVDGTIRKNNSLQGKIVNNTFDLVGCARNEAVEQADKKPIHWKELCLWIEAYRCVVEGNNKNVTLKDCWEKGEGLARVGIVNIKKVAGESSSDADLLNNIIADEEYRELLKEEINIIKQAKGLQLVLCCGTYQQAKGMYDISNKGESCLACGVNVFEYDGVKYVDFIHPSYIIRDALKFAFAKEVFATLNQEWTLKE